MKDMITTAEKDRENRELLVIKTTDKTAMAEVTKISNTIDLDNK